MSWEQFFYGPMGGYGAWQDFSPTLLGLALVFALSVGLLWHGERRPRRRVRVTAERPGKADRP